MYSQTQRKSKADSGEQQNAARKPADKTAQAKAPAYLQRKSAGEETLQQQTQASEPQSAQTKVQKKSEPAEDLQRKQEDTTEKQPEEKILAEDGVSQPFVQHKLEVGAADDPMEKEADAVADAVVQNKPVPDISNADQQASRQTEDSGEETVQAKAEDNEPAKTVSRSAESNESESVQAKFVQRKTFLQAKGAPQLSETANQQVEQMRGNGTPLPDDIRLEMQNKLGGDFSQVNIHTSSDADRLNKEINARAFTVGKDIFFRNGEFSPYSQEGKRLLAHELSHVVQQGGGVQAKIQREDDGTPPPASIGDSQTGLVNRSDKTITFASVQIPAFKGEGHRGEIYDGWNLKRSKNYTGSRPGGQRDIWRRGINTSQIEGILRNKAEQGHFQPEGDTYLFKSPLRPITRGVGRNHQQRDGENYYIGNLTEVARATSAPAWNRRGSLTTAMEVDHIMELQLSGYPEIGRDRVHAIGNMELLERRPNQESGTMIDRDINRKVDRVLADSSKRALLEFSIPGLENQSRRDRRRNLVRNNYDLIFEGYDARGGSRVGDASYWSKAQIEAGEHLSPVEPAHFADLGQPGKALVFPKESGGLGKHFNWNGENTNPTGDERNWFKPFTVIEKRFFTNSTGQQNLWFGEFVLTIPNDGRSKFKPVERETIYVDRIPGTHLAGRVSKQRVRNLAEKLEVEKASPIEMSEVDLSQSNGLEMSGVVNPTIPFLQNTSLNFRFEGGDIYVFKTFSATDLNIPSPFSISNSSLTVSINTANGLEVDGAVEFGIDRLGTGMVSGSVDATGNFGVAGEFNFDERIFGEGTTAQVRMAYENQNWSMGGTISIPEGKVPGVESATINVDYSETEGFSATGEASLTIPGVESGTMEITHNEEEGFSIGGQFNLSGDTPGIRSGSISARVSEKEDGSGYAVSASGTAQPDIPGVNSELTISYNDGAFTAEVTAAYARGMLSGEVNAGVTNRTVNEETGELAETAEEGNPLVVYGGGSLTLQLAPWLQGTAGVRFSPNGEITVTGEIGLPGELEIFARREINKSIFNIAIQAPIVPGIVAEVGGGLGAVAGIGPGVIDQLRLGVEYNPDREEDTRITGDAHLNIPADAGLRLSVRAGIGLGITGASATGGLEIGGTLGIEGAAEAGVHVEWTPTQGLDIEANVGIHAQPSFTFDISGYVSVRALGFSVYDETWELASFSFGSDYRFGINLPIHYQEGQPFDISTDDIEFEVPNIDTNQMLRGLISRIA